MGNKLINLNSVYSETEYFALQGISGVGIFFFEEKIVYIRSGETYLRKEERENSRRIPFTSCLCLLLNCEIFTRYSDTTVIG